MLSRRFLTAAASLALVVSTQAAVWACPGCKEATSDQSLNLAKGFSYSILFMMPIPFIIVGGFGGYVYYTMKRRDARQAGPVKGAPPANSRSPGAGDDASAAP
jgi:hypothetical protein